MCVRNESRFSLTIIFYFGLDEKVKQEKEVLDCNFKNEILFLDKRFLSHATISILCHFFSFTNKNVNVRVILQFSHELWSEITNVL